MAFDIEFSPKADKSLGKLPKKNQKALAIQFDNLAEGKFSPRIKKIKGRPNLLRIRSGDYRAIFSVDRKEKKIYILKIAHRKDAY